MKQVRIGVIGVGNMGSLHCRSIASGNVSGMVLAAVADRSPGRRAWIGENLPTDVMVFEEGSDLIAGDAVDAVLIAVPHYQHPGLAMEAFAHGLHVMCEKPAGVYTREVRKMNAAAQESGRIFGMMFNQRTNPVYRKMHDMVQSGEAGAIRRVNWIVTDWYRTQSYYDSGAWRATWNGEGGGVLLNQCPHNLDLLQWICGMPVSVRAFCHEGKWHDIEVEDDVTAYMEFENGATGVFITSTGDTPGTNRLELTTEKGRLVCDGKTLTFDKLDQENSAFLHSSKDGFAQPGVSSGEVELTGESTAHNGVLRAFTECILDGKPLIADGQEGIRGLMLSNAMHLSSWLGQTVSLPIDEELFVEELNKRRASSRIKEGTGVVFDIKV